jgi:Ca2+-binding EF-hand superfamily protein
LKLNTQDLAKKVFLGVHAILIDQVRVALEKNQMSLGQLFQKYDGNKDGLLEHFEIEKALKDCHLTLGKEMTKIFLEDILSNSKAGSTSVSFGVFKFYLDNINVNQVEVIEQIESGNSAAVKITSDVASSAKMAARKILIKCFANIAEIVGKLDTFDDGVVNKDEIKRAIEAQKVSDLDREELAALFKVCDKGQKGYVSSSKFVENLFSLASESESETIMRRVSKNLA